MIRKASSKSEEELGMKEDSLLEMGERGGGPGVGGLCPERGGGTGMATDRLGGANVANTLTNFKDITHLQRNL